MGPSQDVFFSLRDISEETRHFLVRCTAELHKFNVLEEAVMLKSSEGW